MNTFINTRIFIGLLICLITINSTSAQILETLGKEKNIIDITCKNPISHFDTHLGARKSICADEVIQFENISKFHKSSEWKIFKDGSTQVMESSTTNNLTKQLNPGTYRIELHTYNECASIYKDNNNGHDMKSITLIVNELPKITIDPQNPIICKGNSITLTAIGEAGQELRYHWNTGAHTKSITAAPAVTTTYTVTVTDANGCSNTASTLVTVQDNPVANVTMDPPYNILQNPYSYFFCKGQTVTFINSSSNFNRVDGFVLLTFNQNSNKWDTLIKTTPANSFSYTFTDAGSYAVVLKVGNSCPFVAGIAINFSVYDAPLISINPDNTTICAGNSVTLTAAGADSYLWNTGETTNSIIVTPTTTTTYTVTGTNAVGCSNTASSLVTVRDNSAPVPSIGISSNPDFCVGQTVTFTNTSTNSDAVTAFQLCRMIDTNLDYWKDNNVCEINNTTNSFSHTFTVDGFYKIAVTVVNACGIESTPFAEVFWVSSAPVVSITSDNTTICVGNSVTLTASGADSYVWNTGETTNSTTVAPTTTSTYTVTGTNAAGCSGTASSLVTVRDNTAPVPSIGISPNPNPDFCVGQTVTFTNTSTNSDAVTAFQLCRMIDTNLDYWKDNNVCEINNTTNSFSHTFTVDGFYKIAVTVVNACGIESTPFAEVFWVSSAPVVSITSDNTTICVGNSVTLTASGADSYIWNTGETTNSINVTPTSTFTYNVTGTNVAGCSGTASSLVTVLDNSAPVPSIGISSNPDFCVGQTVTFTNTSTNSDAVTAFQLCRMIDTNLDYWKDNNVCEINNTTNSFSHTFTVDGFYKIAVTVVNACGIESTPFAEVFWVSSAPVVSITSDNTTICVGNSATLTAAGADSYVWNTGANTASINVAPVATTTYTVTGTNAAGCSGTASSTISLTDLTLNCWVELEFNGDIPIIFQFLTQASGGSMPYTYNVYGTDHSGDPIGSGSMGFSGAYATKRIDYSTGWNVYFEVTDANGCSQTCEIINYEYRKCNSLTASPLYSIIDSSDGKRYITYNSSVSGGTGNYSFYWNFSSQNGPNTVPGQTITWVLDGTWCPSSYNTSVNIYDINNQCHTSSVLTGLPSCKTGSTITLAELIANNTNKESTNVTTGIEVNDFHLNIYPNPAYEKVNIEYYYDGNTELTYQISEITGKILKEGILPGSKANATINLSGLSNGIYLLNIKAVDRVIERKKLIKF